MNLEYNKHKIKIEKKIYNNKFPYDFERKIIKNFDKKSFLKPIFDKQKEILLSSKKIPFKFDENNKFSINNKINNNNNNNKNKILPKIEKKSYNYIPKTLKDYKEKYDIINSNYRFPESLGANIGTKDWEIRRNKFKIYHQYNNAFFNNVKIKSKSQSKEKKINNNINNNNIVNNNNNNLAKSINVKNNINLRKEKLPTIFGRIKKNNIKNDKNDEDKEKEFNKVLEGNSNLNDLYNNHGLYFKQIEKIKKYINKY